MNTSKTPESGADTPKAAEVILDQSNLAAKQVTAAPTEADLEARIDAAIRHAFPLLPRGAIRHQTKFSFWFGGNEITVGGKSKDAAQARADVILYFKDKPLAVLELKRIGLPLSEDDSKQGLSYARVMNPMVPLVVISNGHDVRFIEVYSGKEWQPTELSEQSFLGLVKSTMQVAADDLKIAVSTLMATNPDVWVQAIKKATASKIAELTGTWSERLQPFVDKFHIPRKATALVKLELHNNTKLVIVEGAPLAGKSSILRELAEDQNDQASVALFIDIESSTDILQQMADILEQELSWRVSKEETRNWLKHLSHNSGPKLIIVINGIGQRLEKHRDEIIDLTSKKFGPKLALVIELDDTNTDAAISNSTRKQNTAIGRIAKRIIIEALDDDEFQNACRALWMHRIGMPLGAMLSHELRLPWVLRVISSHIVAQPNHENPKLVAGFPPLLGIELIQLTREVFTDEIRTSIRSVATAALEDSQDEKRPISLLLESFGAYVIRRKILKKHMSEAAIFDLVKQGFLKPLLHNSGEAVLVARVPELVASEVAYVVTERMKGKFHRPSDKTAKWLSNIAARLPLGDIIGAQSLVDAIDQGQRLSFDIIISLMGCPPRAENITEGSVFAMYSPDHGTIHITAKAGGFLARTANGVEHFINHEPGDEPKLTSGNVHGRLILSHFAAVPFILETEDTPSVRCRCDAGILLEVAKSPVILCRPNPNSEIFGIPTHEIKGQGTFVCYQAGIIEPITFSLFKFLHTEGEKAEAWIKAAAISGSLPLLARLEIALREMSELAESDVSKFAQGILDSVISPEMAKFLPKH